LIRRKNQLSDSSLEIEKLKSASGVVAVDSA